MYVCMKGFWMKLIELSLLELKMFRSNGSQQGLYRDRHKSQLVSILEKKNTLVTIKSVQASSKPNTKSFIIQRNLNKNKKSSITFKITISINLYGFLVVFKKLVIGMIYIQISEPILG